MTRTIDFPHLGIHLSSVGNHITVFGFDIAYYGMIIGAGILAGIFMAVYEAKRTGQKEEDYYDLSICAVIISIIGARAYYVIFSWDMYKDDLLSIFNLRQGGLAIYGGVIAAVLTVIVFAKVKKLSAAQIFDTAGLGLVLGQAIGRWGNFVNIEAFGGNTSLPWGMSSSVITSYLTEHEAELEALGMNIDPNMPVHPTFLYESIWCLLGFLFLAWYTKRRKFDGELILIYMMWYGAGRAVIEGLRTDSLMIPNTSLRASQMLALAMVIVAAVIWVINTSKVKKAGEKHLFVNSEEGQLIIAGQFYQKKGETAKTSDAEQTHSLFTENAEQSAETAEKKEEVSEVTSEQPEDAAAEEVKQEETVNTEAAEQPAKQEENFLGNESEPKPEEPQEELSEEEK